LGVVVKTLSVTQPTTTSVVRRFLTMGNWLDLWDCMETECKEQVVLLPFPVLRDTLDQYLTKHSFCSECTNMVNRAYTLLVEEGQEPAKAAGELPMEADPKVNRDGSVNLYSGISACTKEGHVHVECDAQFISQLFTIAEPELSGLRQERHAKTIEIAQKEVLICIGLALFERFQRIQQKIKEGEQTCDLLLLVCLKTLRRSLDMAAEVKRGAADIERLCLELEDAEVKKKEGKRERKRKRRERRRCSKKDEKEVDSDEGSLHSGGENHQCGNSKAEKEESIENDDKENTPVANQLKPQSMLYHERGGKQVLGLKSKANNPILSLLGWQGGEGGSHQKLSSKERGNNTQETRAQGEPETSIRSPLRVWTHVNLLSRALQKIVALGDTEKVLSKTCDCELNAFILSGIKCHFLS